MLPTQRCSRRSNRPTIRPPRESAIDVLSGMGKDAELTVDSSAAEG